MSGVHPDIGPELRRLAQKILDQIDPAVRLAAARAVGEGAGTGKCQQVWCPVCALAAVVSGDEHPLLTVVAEHSVALLAVIRAIVDQVDRPATPPDPPPGGGVQPEGADAPAPPSRYQPISVTVDE
ncbi:MAG TPA: hypothetical protein VGG53_03310 [Mycobacterium sp.]|jgi:hypothetical protein|uniref:hypothetical protein n=1 Tax=Mycobacterium sp. TaxID=1785 RepID=UPI002F3FEB9F